MLFAVSLKKRAIDLPLSRTWISLEPVRHKHFVFVTATGSENVGSLNGLVDISKNIKHGDNTLGRVRSSGDV